MPLCKWWILPGEKWARESVTQQVKLWYNGQNHGYNLPPLGSAAAAAAKSLQSCPTLCDPIDGSPPGSSAPGILQARALERVAISFSSAWKWKVKVKSLQSCPTLPATPWTAAYQAPPCMGFSRQEYWSGVPLPSPALGSSTWSSLFHSVGQHRREVESNLDISPSFWYFSTFQLKLLFSCTPLL